MFGKQPNTYLKRVHVFEKFPEVNSAAVLRSSICVFFWGWAAYQFVTALINIMVD